MSTLREDAFKIIENAINGVMPDTAIEKALSANREIIDNVKGRIVLISIGKAAFTMAKKFDEVLGQKVHKGLIVTKYGHLKEGLDRYEKIEAGHPILDENSLKAGGCAIEYVKDLNEKDLVVLLLSGGGSAVFESPYKDVTIQDITIVTDQLLASGASIEEINTVRKHMSDLKGGRFAQKCPKTPILAIALSDVIGDRFDTIASGPVHPDESTSEMAAQVVDKYNIFTPQAVREALKDETPKVVQNVVDYLAGGVKDLCNRAAASAQSLGYEPLIMTTSLDCEAREAGRLLGAIARDIGSKEGSMYPQKPCALIFGGETVVHVKGKGLGGRNQELALAAARAIRGVEGVSIFSVGSDGTDGPTDAAGGIIDGESYGFMWAGGIDPDKALEDNDSYRALLASGDLIVTGPTGTNVNDLMVILSK